MRKLFLAFVLLRPVGTAADFAAGFEAAQHSDYSTAEQQQLEPTFGTGGK